jgi:phage protein D
MLKRAICKVIVDGKDVTSTWDPLLISVSIKLADGGKSDTCDVVLDDRGGNIKMPRTGAKIQVMLAWMDMGGAVSFQGITDEPQSSGSRGSGMTLSISAKAADMSGKPKEKQDKHEDKKKFKEVAEKWGKKSGLQVKVQGKLADIERPYWAMQNESFLAWGQRMARDMGATFKIQGKEAVFVERNSNESAGGQQQQLGNVKVIYGLNLIDWSLTPIQSRQVYDEVESKWYDRKEAKWKTEKKESKSKKSSGGGGSDKVVLKDNRTHTTKEEAEGKNEANSEELKRDKGGGSVTVDGEPNAQPQAMCMVQGIRQGIDGQYRITSCTHSYSRSSGWTTDLELGDPEESQGGGSGNSQGGAGGGA